METKHCDGCASDKPLSEFYRDVSYPGGLKAVCKSCHNKRTVQARTRRKLREVTRKLSPDVAFRQTANKLALELLCLKYDETKGPVHHPTKVEGALYPMKVGVEILEGTLGPVVVFQTPTKRIRKSLSIEPLDNVAQEMDNWGIQIIMQGLPEPPEGHPLEKKMLKLGLACKDLKI